MLSHNRHSRERGNPDFPPSRWLKVWIPTFVGMTGLRVNRVTVIVECTISSKDKLGEGCLWDAASQCLWWLDIARPTRIQRFNPTTGEHKIWTSSLLLTAIAKRKSGGFVVGGEDGVYGFDPVTGATTLFCSPETDVPPNRMNDGSCDPQGRCGLAA